MDSANSASFAKITSRERGASATAEAGVAGTERYCSISADVRSDGARFADFLGQPAPGRAASVFELFATSTHGTAFRSRGWAAYFHGSMATRTASLRLPTCRPADGRRAHALPAGGPGCRSSGYSWNSEIPPDHCNSRRHETRRDGRCADYSNDRRRWGGRH